MAKNGAEGITESIDNELRFHPFLSMLLFL